MFIDVEVEAGWWCMVGGGNLVVFSCGGCFYDGRQEGYINHSK